MISYLCLKSLLSPFSLIIKTLSSRKQKIYIGNQTSDMTMDFQASTLKYVFSPFFLIKPLPFINFILKIIYLGDIMLVI